MWQLEEVVRAVTGTLWRVNSDCFTGISTDSRTIRKGELFVPLKGPLFDGHMFIEAAIARGAGGSLCDMDRAKGLNKVEGTVILVEDADRSLLDLARYCRMRIDAKFIALTGSNGKTTTKELLARMMETTFRVFYNERNYNNRIGVSQAIIAITDSPAFVILELGSNNRGEIAELAALVQPDMSLITNVNPSHLQGFGDIEGVLREKTDLFRATSETGALFINLDDERLSPYKSDPSRSIHTFSMKVKADSTLRVRTEKGLAGYEIDLKLGNKSVTVNTSLLGVHNLYNILAAAAVAHQAGVPIENIARAIEGSEAYSGRFKRITSSKGYTIIDDTYNANPASMEKAIATLQGLPCRGKRIAIIGDMKELGEETAYYHRELGRLLYKAGIDLVLLLGDQVRVVQDEVKNGHALFFPERFALADHVRKMADKDDIILVKGSRALGMDGIVKELL